MKEETVKELGVIQSDLVVLEGMLETMKDFAYSADYCEIAPLVHIGNSLEIAIAFLSSRSEHLDQIYNRGKLVV